MKSRFLLFSLCLMMLTACGRFEGTFHFLRKEPDAKSIPGVYIIDRDSYSYEMLRSRGYIDLSARVILNENGSFSISQMPDCWLTDFANPKGGYDSCSGTWSLYKKQSVYTVSLDMDHWSDDSTYVRNKNNPRFGYTGAFILTKEKEGYGLALALAAGDEGFIYFRREKESQK